MSAAASDSWWRRRPGLAGALLLGTIAALLALARALHEPGWATDFDQFHFAARAIWRGENPYGEIGPGRTFEWDWPLYYPLPSVLLVMPLAWLPVVAGRVAFAASSGAILGYALFRTGFWRLPIVFSAAFMIAVFRSQWSPLITAAFFLPWAGIFLAAKPNMAVPLLAGARSRRHALVLVGLGVAAGLVSLLVKPAWPLDWWRLQQTRAYLSAPVIFPGGFFLLLSLVRWRRPEARVFLALVCVPQTPSLYDLLPLFVVPRTRREVTVLALLTTALFATVVFMGPFPTFNAYAYRLGRAAIWVVYLPVLLMILRRPNVAEDPEAGAGTPARDVRGWVASLSRIDAVLLLMAVASSAFLFWVTLASRRP